MKSLRIIGSFVIVLSCLWMAVPREAEAYPVYRRYFQDHYGVATRCEACHEYGGSSNRNSFGDAFKKAGENGASFKKLDELDSDGDGFSNRAEAEAVSNPGDERSTPESTNRLWKRALRTIPVPREQLALVMGDSTSLELLELKLTPEQVTSIIAGTKINSEALDKHPTLYFGAKKDVRNRVAIFRHFRSKHGLFSLLLSVDTKAKVERVVLFRAGEHSPGKYLEYLQCYTGKKLDELPIPGKEGCPDLPDATQEVQGIRTAITSGIRTVIAVLSSHPEEAKEETATATVGKASAADEKTTKPDDFDLQSAETTQTVSLESPPERDALAIASMILLLLLIAGTVRLAIMSGGSGNGLPRLHKLPASLKLLIGMVFFSLLCVQVVAAITILYQTTEVHDSVTQYFAYMSYSSLLGLSHSHIFGFGIMYGVIGLMLCMTDRSELVKCVLIATILWAGVFDVASWWGMKHFSESFHMLSFLSGGASGLASMCAVVFVGLGLRAPKPVRELS